MADYKPATVRRAFEHKIGASTEEDRKHIFFTVRDADGTILGETHISHGRDPIGDRLIGLMARNLDIPAPVLRDMIQCTVTKDAFLQHLRDEPVR